MLFRLFPVFGIALFLLIGCSPSTSLSTTGQPSAPQRSALATRPVVVNPQPAQQTSPPTKLSPPKSSKTASKPTNPSPPAEPTIQSTPAPSVSQGPIPVPNLSLSPAGGLFGSGTNLTIDVDQAKAEVRYTLDGSDPGPGLGTLYTAPIPITKTETVKVWSALSGGQASTSSAFFTVGEVVASPDGTGDGSWDSPMGGLQAAVTKALASGATTVRLESGTYKESVLLSHSLTVSGGWKGFGQKGAVSIIQAPAQPGTSQKNPSAALKIVGNSTVVLDGLTLKGSDDSFAAAVSVQSEASITIQSCVLSGGGGSYSYGLRAVGASVKIEDSELSGGDGGSTFGVSTDTTSIDLRRSTLDAGTGTVVSYALSMTGSKGTVVSSVLWGGSANSSYAAALYSSPNVELVADTLHGGKGSSAWGVFIAESRPQIVDCLIGAQGDSKSYGIYENYGNSVPKEVSSCVFFGAKTALYFDNATKSACNALNSAGSFFSAGSGKILSQSLHNQHTEVSLGAPPELVTAPLSTLKMGTEAASAAARDRLGRARRLPWTVGAYETVD